MNIFGDSGQDISLLCFRRIMLNLILWLNFESN